LEKRVKKTNSSGESCESSISAKIKSHSSDDGTEGSPCKKKRKSDSLKE
jgi:hypothetical protein